MDDKVDELLRTIDDRLMSLPMVDQEVGVHRADRLRFLRFVIAFSVEESQDAGVPLSSVPAPKMSPRQPVLPQSRLSKWLDGKFS